jgi:hypothetical protein
MVLEPRIRGRFGPERQTEKMPCKAVAVFALWPDERRMARLMSYDAQQDAIP